MALVTKTCLESFPDRGIFVSLTFSSLFSRTNHVDLCQKMLQNETKKLTLQK